MICQTKSLNWYIDFISNDKILISKYYIENLIAEKGLKYIYTTFIDNKILFIVNNEFTNNSISKSKYSVDLGQFIGKENYSTVDYSFWVIQNKGGKYKIIKERRYKCDE
ncbi:hypothetical protein [Flavobacterium flavipallidum]|uniref:Uncharacterized protein n=1 Tax=Flavobacterium flavipallidum TaxID=3139140 RepID=A0ABU9HPD7_9FLAO